MTKKCPVKALHDQVVIKQSDNDEKMYGNIIIPDTGKEKPLMGTVVHVGPGQYTITGVRMPMSVKEGDIVFFPSFGGTKITYESEDYVVCKESSLLAYLEEQKEPLDPVKIKELLDDTKKNMTELEGQAINRNSSFKKLFGDND